MATNNADTMESLARSPISMVKSVIKRTPVLGSLLLPLLQNWWLIKRRAQSVITWPGYKVLETRRRLSARFRSARCLSDENRQPPVIVSLTTIPSRIDKVHLCIDSILNQSFAPNRVILWLSETNTPVTLRPDHLPASIRRLQRRGLEVRFCPDVRSYRKIVYTLQENPDCIIVTADDDVLYPQDWLEKLYRSWKQEPSCIHCYRAHLMTRSESGELRPYTDWNKLSRGMEGSSLRLFPVGIAGVLYPPGSLHADVLDEERFQSLCPTNDDIWLKAMSLRNGVLCRKVDGGIGRQVDIRGTQQQALWKINITGDARENDRQIQATFGEFELINQPGERDDS